MYTRLAHLANYLNLSSTPRVGLIILLAFIFARDSIICYSAYMLSPFRLSVLSSVTRVDQSKTVEVRIMQLSPQSSPMTLQGGPKMAHGVYGNNFVYSQSYLIIFGTCTL